MVVGWKEYRCPVVAAVVVESFAVAVVVVVVVVVVGRVQPVSSTSASETEIKRVCLSLKTYPSTLYPSTKA